MLQGLHSSDCTFHRFGVDHSSQSIHHHETCDALAKCTLKKKNNSDEVRPLATVTDSRPGGPLFSFSPLLYDITKVPSVSVPSVSEGSFDYPTYNHRGRLQLINWSASEDVIRPPACGVYLGGIPPWIPHITYTGNAFPHAISLTVKISYLSKWSIFAIPLSSKGMMVRACPGIALGHRQSI